MVKNETVTFTWGEKGGGVDYDLGIFNIFLPTVEWKVHHMEGRNIYTCVGSRIPHSGDCKLSQRYSHTFLFSSQEEQNIGEIVTLPLAHLSLDKIEDFSQF